MAGAKATDTWLSRAAPPGFGRTKPQLYRDILGALWQNRSQLRYAWNVLNHGVCDGCSLGPRGLRDSVLDGMHLCRSRLQWLKLHTMSALDLSALGDVARLRRMRPEQLRSLGRLAHPMVRGKGQRGFLRVTWEEAFDAVCKSIRKAAPHELAFLATSRGLTNEVYYVFQKLARVLGTNNVDLCSPHAHAPSVAGLKATLGYGAATCSLGDCIGTGLLVVLGSDLAENQPLTARYIRGAKKAGTRIAVVNSTGNGGSERHGDLAIVNGADKWMGDFYALRNGGEIAFINGVLKFLLLAERVDRHFIDRHTNGFAELAVALAALSWNMLEERAGVSREEMQRFAEAYSQARTAVFVYGTGFAGGGADNVKAVVNLALSRGMVSRDKCGILPIRAHSGVQGGEECGLEPDKFPGGFAVKDDAARRFSNLWHHPVPSRPGLEAPHMIAAAYEGRMKFLYSLGGDLLETMADPQGVTEALAKISVRVHQDLVLNSSMLIDPEEAVVLLPGQTRYEQRTGGTSTSTDRRICFTPEIPGHQVGEALPDWEIPVLVGRKAMSNGDKLFPFDDSQSIREEMSRVMPIYQGVEKLTKEGDYLQWGGPQLYRDGFMAMPENRALFTVLDPANLSLPWPRRKDAHY